MPESDRLPMNKTVLMSDALNFSAFQAINPHYFDPEADSGAAQDEHDSIAHAFGDAGIKVVTVASPSDSQDGVYTANWALVRGDKAVLARLPNVRKAEEAHARAVLEDLGKEVVEVPQGLRFSGQGDALACGDYLFCGSGYRSDVEAQAFAADILGYQRIQLHTVEQLDSEGRPVINPVSGWEDSYYYDIDLALSVLRVPTAETAGLIAYCPSAFDEESREKLARISEFTDGRIETIEICEEEARDAFAANLVSTGSTVVMSGSAQDFKARLEAMGFDVVSPQIKELIKGGGYIRCTSLTLD